MDCGVRISWNRSQDSHYKGTSEQSIVTVYRENGNVNRSCIVLLDIRAVTINLNWKII